MATEVKFRKGTDSQSDAFTGALAEVTVDTTTKTLRVHDGATPGGSELVNLDASQTLGNKTLNSFTVSGSITANSSTGTSGQYLESTGSGVQWSNIDTSSISNGNSNVSVSQNSNVTVSVSDSTSATFSTDGLVVAGNLTVNGTTTTVNSNEVSIGDSIIDLNADISSGTSPTQDGGIAIIRGSEANKSLLWNEAIDKWSIGTETFVAGAFEGNVTGNVTGQVSDISNHSTSDLSEGTNLYYTDTRARGAISATGSLSYNSSTGVISFTQGDTDTVTEGATNLYYTDTRARNAISASGDLAYNSTTGTVSFTERTDAEVRGLLSAAGDLSYNSTTGEFSVTTFKSSDFDSNFSGKSTTDLSEGTNLYYTDTRARNALSATGDLSYNSTTGAFSFTERTDAEVRGLLSATGDLSYNSTTGTFSVTTFKSSDFDSNFSGKSTSDLSEGTNLYYTDARVDAHLSGGTGITFSSGTISHSDTSSVGDVTASSNTFVDALTFDNFGHVTAVSTSTAAPPNDATITVSAGTGLSGGGNFTTDQSTNETISLDVDTSTIATRSYVDTEVSNLVDSSPATLDTLNELAAALGDDPNFATTVANDIGTKADNSTTVTAGSGLSGGGTLGSNFTISHTDTSSQSSVNNSGTTVIQDISLDTFGHITDINSKTISRTDLGIDTNDSVTFGTLTVPAINKNGTDGVGNIGSSANSFNTVHAKATSAQYADVAEKYVSDNTYSPATVVKIGGEKEVTISTTYADSKVAGVITTNPALLMNKNLESEYVADIALTGRVPCQVVGEIKKGDVLTTSDISGVATRLFNEDFVPGCIIGKALEDYSSEQPGTIEILVGKV